jgi:ferric-dicitrate binding protein FerR (iron transport regulator)
MSERFSQLFERMTRGELTPQEKSELDTYFEATEYAGQARQMLDAWYDQVPVQDLQSSEDADRIFHAIMGKGPHITEMPGGRISFAKVRRILAWSAAACLAALAVGIYFTQRGKVTAPSIALGDVGAVQPGKTGAVLTLADGTQVELDSLGNTTLPSQPGAGVSVTNGQLIYNSTTKDDITTPSFNIMTTPKGRQFAIRLPDGTRVWLNAASSLKYPTVFYSGERRVAVKGEAYFEVAKNARQPFVIEVKDRGVVEVLGTDFNIHAYENEPAFTTTLINGAVRVRKPHGDSGVVLRPGQEAIASVGKEIAVRTADLDRAVVWKEGFFSFDQAPLPEVMRQLERWYDIEVIYQGKVPDMKFSGEISRTMDFGGVLRILEKSNVHFRYENNRKLVVIP